MFRREHHQRARDRDGADYRVERPGENGFRNIFSTKEIRTPSDLQGTKIRIMENEIQTTTFSELGAIVTNMASGEVYTGLQQGTIDAAENAICAYYSSAYYEVCKELSLTEHFYGATALLMSSAVYDSLTEEQQNILTEAAKEACEFGLNATKDGSDANFAALEGAGLEVVDTDVDSLKAKINYNAYACAKTDVGKQILTSMGVAL